MRLLVLPLIVFSLLQAQELSHTAEPVVIHRVDPQYTKEALTAKLEGDVLLSLIIREDGTPSQIKVVRNLGRGLDEKAIECVRQWRWKPATHEGEPFSTQANVLVSFRLLQPSKSK